MATKAPESPLTKSSAIPPIPTPSYPTNDGLFTVLNTTTICAPPSSVLSALLDYKSYPKWNTFVPLTTPISLPEPDRLEVGTELYFYSNMKDGGPLRSTLGGHLVVAIDDLKEDENGKEGWRVVWKTIGVPGGDWVFRDERVQEMAKIVLEDGSVGTAYKSWGTFGGPLAYMMNWTAKEQIVERCGTWANDLKAYVEGLEGRSVEALA